MGSRTNRRATGLCQGARGGAGKVAPSIATSVGEPIPLRISGANVLISMSAILVGSAQGIATAETKPRTRAQERVMKILRSVNRRGFNVGSAGWFTVLTPNTWFPASRLPVSFHYPSGRSKGLAEPESRETTIPSQILKVATKDRRLLQQTLIVMAAMVITAVFLWWIMGARPLR